MIRLMSVHSPADEDRVPRYLVDWNWPSRAHHRTLRLAGWPRRLLPDAALWDWFHHDSAGRTAAFRTRYFRHLDANEKHWAPIARAAASGDVVLLYDPKKARLRPAQFLKEFLEIRLKADRVPKAARRKKTVSEKWSVAPPVEKAVSRKRGLPLKEEMSFRPEQRLKQVPAQNRRVLR